MKSDLPSISVVIATFNSEKTIAKTLESVRSQDYPQEKIEIIIADGSSTDKTRTLVKKYRTRIFTIHPQSQSAEYNKGVGVNKSRNEVLLLIDHDNLLPHKNWLRNMVFPLQNDKNIVGTDPLYVRYNPNDTSLNRYLALFGSLDPVAYYLKKPDKLSRIERLSDRFVNARKKNNYYFIHFSQKFVPTFGGNGFLVRRKLLVENANITPESFFHIDVIVDLVRKGYTKYAFVNEEIVHLTEHDHISGFLNRRKKFMEQYNIVSNSKRRYSVYMPQDTINLILFIIYASTFIKPTYDSLRGYVRIHDTAWFLHPIFCFLFLMMYSMVIIKILPRKIFSRE